MRKWFWDLIGIAILIMVVVLCVLVFAGLAYGDEPRPIPKPDPQSTVIELIALVIIQEAVSEPVLAQVVVAGVVLDRADDPRWPDTATGVAWQPRQFTGIHRKTVRHTRAEWITAEIAAITALEGVRPCGTVLWYHRTDRRGVTSDLSRWPAMREACVMGAHTFFGDAS